MNALSLAVIRAVSMLACLATTMRVASAAEHSLELLVLGSGGPGATGRAASSYVLLLDDTPRILVDAGPGSFVRIGETNTQLEQLDLVLLTHLHVDHVGELAAVIKARAVASAGPIKFEIFGPNGSAGGRDAAVFPSTRRYTSLLFGPQGAYAYLSEFAAPVTLQVHDVPVKGSADHVPHAITAYEGLNISAVAGHHGDAPAVAYRVEYAGKSIVFSGDIDPSGLPALRKLAAGADLLVFNCVVLDPPQAPPALYALHSPPVKIGQTARAAGVHALLLSHLSPATEGAQAAVRDSIGRSYDGPVRFAEDALRLLP